MAWRTIYEGNSEEEAADAVAQCLERAVPGSVFPKTQRTSDLATQIANQRAGSNQKKSRNDQNMDMMTGFLGGKK